MEPYKMSDGTIIVFFDLETTGLDTSRCDIIQLGAICNQMSFDRHTFPVCRIHKKASEVHGYTVRNGRLLYYEQRVRTVPKDQMLTSFISFISFLQSFNGRVLLAAHNARKFDAVVLSRVMWEWYQLPRFQQVFSGFLDTLKLSRKLHPYLQCHSLECLAQYFHCEGYIAHNALEDSRILQELFTKWQPDNESVRECIFRM